MEETARLTPSCLLRRKLRGWIGERATTYHLSDMQRTDKMGRARRSEDSPGQRICAGKARKSREEISVDHSAIMT